MTTKKLSKKIKVEDDDNLEPFAESSDSGSDEDSDQNYENSDEEHLEEEETDDEQSGGGDDDHLDEDPDEPAGPDEDGDGEYDAVQEEELAEEDPEEEVGEEEGEVGDDFEVESKTCYAKNLNKDFIVMDDDDSTLYGKLEYTKIPDDQRETGNIMTYYEIVRVLGTRAQQFNLGAPPLVANVESLTPAQRAYVELMALKTPYTIRRNLPHKKYEDWNIAELEIVHKIDEPFFVPEGFDLEKFKAKNKIK